MESSYLHILKLERTIIPADGRRDWGAWQTFKNGKEPFMPSRYSPKKDLLPGTKGFDYRWAWF